MARSWRLAAMVAAVSLSAVLPAPAIAGNASATPAAARPLAVMTGTGHLTLVDSMTGDLLDSLGQFGDQVDPGLAYSASDNGVFFLQLRNRREKLVEVSTVTKRLTVLAGASAFALSPDGKHVACISQNGRSIAVLALGTGVTTTWSPGSALPTADFLPAVAWLNDRSALVEPAPAPSTAVAGAATSDASAVPPPWFEATVTAHALTGRSLTPPAVSGDETALSHDGARPSTVFDLVGSSRVTVQRLTVSGHAVIATEVAHATVTVALALSPRGQRLVFVENHDRAGKDHIDLEVCAISASGACVAQLLQPDTRLGEVAWQTG